MNDLSVYANVSTTQASIQGGLLPGGDGWEGDEEEEEERSSSCDAPFVNNNNVRVSIQADRTVLLTLGMAISSMIASIGCLAVLSGIEVCRRG